MTPTSDDFDDDREQPLRTCRPLGWVLLLIAILIAAPLLALFGSIR